MISSSNNCSISGIQKYCDLLEEIKLRIKSVQSIVNGDVSEKAFGDKIFAEEFMFLQIRKILELIAFGSLSSNIVVYEKTHSDYANNWRAKNILKRLRSINRDFYPLPLRQKDLDGDQHILENVREGFLTEDDLVHLYDVSSQIIHSTNPYAEVKKVDLQMSIDDWMHRIASLLWFHRIKLVDSNKSWLVYLMHPETGKSYAIQTVDAINS